MALLQSESLVKLGSFGMWLGHRSDAQGNYEGQDWRRKDAGTMEEDLVGTLRAESDGSKTGPHLLLIQVNGNVVAAVRL